MQDLEKCKNKIDVLEHLISKCETSKRAIPADILEAINLSNECNSILSTLTSHNTNVNSNEILSMLVSRLDSVKVRLMKVKDMDIDGENTNEFLSSIESGKRTSALLDEFILSIENCKKQGNEVLSELNDQKEVLGTMKGDLDSISGILNESGQLLKSIARKACYNKFFLLGLICFLFVSIFVDIDIFYIKHKK